MLKLSNCTAATVTEWCEKFSKFKPAPMDDTLTDIFIRLCLNESTWEESGLPREIQDRMSEDFIYRIISSRVKLYNYNLTESVKCLLAYLLETPGEVTMYLSYLQYKASELDIDMITIKEFAVIFPIGYPSKHHLNMMWDEQKCDGFPDNLLDHLELFSSNSH